VASRPLAPARANPGRRLTRSAGQNRKPIHRSQLNDTARQGHQTGARGVARGAGSITIAFGAIVLAMLPAVLDQTILATALPTIADDLGRLTDVPWVISLT
jgi:hypothetical protein